MPRSSLVAFLGNPRGKRRTALPARVFDSGAGPGAGARSLRCQAGLARSASPAGRQRCASALGLGTLRPPCQGPVGPELLYERVTSENASSLLALVLKGKVGWAPTS